MDTGGPNLVRLHVFLHVRLLSEGSTAHDTLKGFFTRVTSHVLLKVKVLGKDFVAVSAL